jgi:hypothetical protein
VTLRKSAASSTVRASGPKCEIESKTVGRISIGIRPRAGFNPTIPQKEAGMRTDPPMSVPSARLAHPVATATAEPPDEPPDVRVGSLGLRVIPQSGLEVKLE